MVFTYFTCYAAAQHNNVLIDYGPLEWNARAATAITGGALSFAAAYTCVTLGTEQLVNFNVGRSQTGTTSLSASFPTAASRISGNGMTWS